MTGQAKEINAAGVILAAGREIRAYPASHMIPKSLLEVDGKPLIERNIDIMRDRLGLKRILVVVGDDENRIVDFFNNRNMGVDLTFVHQQDRKGIGQALLLAEAYTGDEKFFVILGDELYIDSNHEDLLEFLDADVDAVLMFKEETDKAKIAANYTGKIRDDKVLSLTEKPRSPDTNLMGVGTYLLSRRVYQYIRHTEPSPLRGEVEITDVLSNMARERDVHACILSGTYLNVNDIDDLNAANYLLRQKRINQCRVSVVIPAYNEEVTITSVITDFINHKDVDDVVVVDNNSKDRTGELSIKAGARVVMEEKQGYGAALKKGLDQAEGDIVILTEADGTFDSRDVPKFLEYLKDCDMVVGTRTTRQMIEQGANMNPLIRLGNIVYGKIIELLWWRQGPRFTDVGCTYRAIWKTSYKDIQPYLVSRGRNFLRK